MGRSFVPALLLAACSTGASATEPPRDDAGASEAATDDASAGADAAASPLPVTIASAAGVAFASGNAQQQHLVFLQETRTWVLFHLASASPHLLLTKTSRDFATWTDGPSLALPHAHGNEGRKLCAASGVAGTVDVAHVGLSLRLADGDRRYFDARLVAGNALAFSPIQEVSRSTVNAPRLEQDGCSVVMGTDGFVTHFTGVHSVGSGTGNAYVFRSSVADDGAATWTPTWGLTDIETVPQIVSARASVALDSGALLFLYESATIEPDAQNLRYTRSSSGAWSAEQNVFAAGEAMNVNDWTALRVGYDDIHVVRLRKNGPLDVRRYVGTAFVDGPSPAPVTLAEGGGLVLASTPDGATLFAFDPAGALRASTWNGGTYGAWRERLPALAGRSALAGANARTAAASALIWTENGQIVGLRLR